LVVDPMDSEAVVVQQTDVGPAIRGCCIGDHRSPLRLVHVVGKPAKGRENLRPNSIRGGQDLPANAEVPQGRQQEGVLQGLVRNRAINGPQRELEERSSKLASIVRTREDSSQLTWGLLCKRTAKRVMDDCACGAYRRRFSWIRRSASRTASCRTQRLLPVPGEIVSTGKRMDQPGTLDARCSCGVPHWSHAQQSAGCAHGHCDF